MRDRFRPPPDLQEAFRQLCEPFGGPAVVETFLPPQAQEYLLLFPGFVYVVSSWAGRVNLVEHGYIPNTVYKVYDHRMHFLYAERCEGVWGEREHDQQLLAHSQHGSYVHIQFRTRSGPLLGVFWIATRFAPERWRYILDRWEDRAAQARRTLDQHEIFFETLCLPRRPLRSYFLPGHWEDQLLPSQIRAHPEVLVQSVDPPTPLVAYPQSSGWLTFDQDETLVVLQEIRGAGARRVRTGPGCSLYLHLTQDALQAPHPTVLDVPGRLTGSAWAGSDPRMSLTATLARVAPHERAIQVPWPREQWAQLQVGLAGPQGELKRSCGYERQPLRLEWNTATGSVVFRLLGSVPVEAILVGIGADLVTFPLHPPLTIEDSRPLVLSLVLRDPA